MEDEVGAISLGWRIQIKSCQRGGGTSRSGEDLVSVAAEAR